MKQRQHTWWRLDGGFGSDGSINWLLPRGYPLLVKGYSGRRAKATAQALPSDVWQRLRTSKAVAIVPEAVSYVLPTQTLAVRWRNERGQLKYALLIHTLDDYSPLEVVQLYEGRGSQEVEIKDDKLGLQLVRRRKQRWNAQATWVILTDIAHNLLTWTQEWMFPGSRFETYGPLRLIQDVLTIPGRLAFGGRHGDRLERVALQRSHPYARDMQACLSRLFKNLNG
jgi:hypothetical protein